MVIYVYLLLLVYIHVWLCASSIWWVVSICIERGSNDIVTRREPVVVYIDRDRNPQYIYDCATRRII